jgi:enamine deaminase RidA (YjgF/YER057c/UK114 family)
MIERQRYSSGTKWETIVGYSRAVRVGNRIYVTGTTATNDEGKVVGVGDVYAQAIQAIKNIESSQCFGRGIAPRRPHKNVRHRYFALAGNRAGAWRVFADIMPATSMVEVSKLIDPEMLVEIEADAEF